jgi:hypothetical protein
LSNPINVSRYEAENNAYNDAKEEAEKFMAK